MTTFTTALRSTLGRKYMMGLTGLIWVGFAVAHLIGNFLLFSGREAFNSYAHFLATLGHGKAIYVAEVFLVVTIASHVLNGLGVVLERFEARPEGYQVSGRSRRKTIASQGMIFTGSALFLFLCFHIATFKLGIGMPEFADYQLEGTQTMVEDLYARVVWSFANPVFVGIYTVIMLSLFMHLKHGVWSALQSLGLLTKKTYPVAVTLAGLVATVLAIGFLALPLTIFAMNDTFMNGPGGLHL